MPSDTVILFRYAAFASITAAALFYVLGPSILPDERHKGLKKHDTVGLSNSANDCFTNSVLQALAASEKIRKYLKDVDSAVRNAELDQSLCQVTDALSAMLERLNDPVCKGQTTSANAFIHALEKAFRARFSRQQQDAQELLQLIFEKLDEEASARQRAQPPQHHGEHCSDPPIKGRLESQIECLHCNYRPPPKASDFLMLSLTVPHQGTATLDQCFDGLLKQELIEDYICAKCKVDSVIVQKKQHLARRGGNAGQDLANEIKDLESQLDQGIEDVADRPEISTGHAIPRRQINKHTRITRFPDVLVVHLSRSIFGSHSSKNTAQVKFSEHLRLGSFERHEYRLVSVVTHRGGHNSGHYETFRRQTDTRDVTEADAATERAAAVAKKRKKHAWWGISDDKVRECVTADVLSLQRDCYLLFYERITLK